jgi:hypothetical protein
MLTIVSICLLPLSRGQQRVDQNADEPVLVLLRGPPALAQQQAVDGPASKRPEDIPRGRVIELQGEAFRRSRGKLIMISCCS